MRSGHVARVQACAMLIWSVSITVDAGYRTQLASGSGINAPFSFDFDTCGAGGGFTGPGKIGRASCRERAEGGAAGGTMKEIKCPVAGGTCIAIPYSVSGTGVVTSAPRQAAVGF